MSKTSTDGHTKEGQYAKTRDDEDNSMIVVAENQEDKLQRTTRKDKDDSIIVETENQEEDDYYNEIQEDQFQTRALKIPRDAQHLQQRQSVVENNNASDVSENSSKSHAPASEECSESQIPFSGECSKSPTTVGHTSSEAAGTSTDQVGGYSNIEEDSETFNDSLNTAEPVTHNDSALQTCFICEKQRKRYHGREVRLAVNRLKTIENIKNAATEQNDVSMLEKLSSFSDDSKTTYHKCCKDQYLRDIYKDESSEFLTKRKASNTAYTILCDMLEEKVVKNNECFFFDFIKNEYKQLLQQQYSLLSHSISDSSFSDRHLERKLMETFAKKIKIIYAEKKKFLAPFSATFLTHKDLFKTMAEKETIRLVATQLRKEILNSTKRELPENCTAEDLMMGECDNVPELLTCFLESLIWGDVFHRSKKEREIKKNKTELSIFSIGQDLIYAASVHKIKTSEHITLGLAVKSLCNNYGWKVVEDKLEMIWFAGVQLPKAYEDVIITPDILEDTPELDTLSEDEIEPEEEDDSTDEDDD
ncbi:hypothetical protein PYW08_006095 [Mythimna loreyi]|uniref:Uncharacterized protein n=1 Tax=Mythimna loreyi TaxID=667449 RepID=A0ACC2QQN4_9NEOP|nr:hypothetical protein PYW08_006095 [Mythimna loreyi]